MEKGNTPFEYEPPMLIDYGLDIEGVEGGSCFSGDSCPLDNPCSGSMDEF